MSLGCPVRKSLKPPYNYFPPEGSQGRAGNRGRVRYRNSFRFPWADEVEVDEEPSPVVVHTTIKPYLPSARRISQAQDKRVVHLEGGWVATPIIRSASRSSPARPTVAMIAKLAARGKQTRNLFAIPTGHFGLEPK